MKHLTVIWTGLFLLMNLAAVHAIHKTMPSETFVPLPGPYADAVYKYITVEDPYKQWDLWPGKGKHYRGKHPHGALLTTYINDNARYSLKAGEHMASGSFIVKENYTPEKKLSAVTVMYKIKGYNPDEGDWFWAKYDMNGKALSEGKVKKCIECHSEMKENDYIFTGKPVSK
jgi:hypothetical protein